MRRLREQCDARGIAQKKKDDQTRLEETERRMITGEMHPTQKRILEIMEQHKPVPLSEAEVDALIEETERRMMGLPAPSNIESVKVRVDDPEFGLGNAVRVPQQAALRTFILVHGRAPNRHELEELSRQR
jgi:hypothetical protein